jgi:hypothetical protein
VTCRFNVACVIDYPWAQAQAELLAEDFPEFAICLEPTADSKVRYIARGRSADIHPRMVITSDVTELRAALSGGGSLPPA